MRDKKLWASAWARFEAYRNNLPSTFDEERVQEYQSILQDLRAASGEFLNEFAIAPDRMKPHEIPVLQSDYPVTRPSVAPRKVYSEKKFCDPNYMKQKVEGLWRYLRALEADSAEVSCMEAGDRRDYWTMSDKEIESLGMKYNIPTIKGAYLDRGGIIDALLKRDSALRPGKDARPNSLTVGTMVGSSIQQGSPGAVSTVKFQSRDPQLTELLGKIRKSLDSFQLSPAAHSEVAADIATIEAQLVSPHPKASVITDCLNATRAILEGTAGSMLAYEIVRFLGVR